MNEFKGTKGKWTTEKYEDGLSGIWKEAEKDGLPTLVARTCYLPQSEANAHLIAAAPELLEALQMVVNADTIGEYQHAIENAGSVISKALNEK